MSLWLIMLAVGALTFAIRLSFILLWGQIEVPGWLQRALRFVPPAVLTAIIFPELLMPAGVVDVSFSNTRLVAGLLAAIVVWRTRNIVLTILVGMGVLPLVFKDDQSWRSLGLAGSETFSIIGIETRHPRKVLQVRAAREDGSEISFEVIARLDTQIEVEYFVHGGILPYALRKILGKEEN